MKALIRLDWQIKGRNLYIEAEVDHKDTPEMAKRETEVILKMMTKGSEVYGPWSAKEMRP